MATDGPVRTFLDYARALESLRYDTPGLVPHQPRALPANAGTGPRILLFSPHPDDGPLFGGIARRAQYENGAQVTDYAVTLGSNMERRRERWQELQGEANYLGWNYYRPQELGLDGVKAEKKGTAQWLRNKDITAANLHALQPNAIVVSGREDRHSTHEGAYWLLSDALEALNTESGWTQPIVFASEYWRDLRDPNLMVELSAEHVADLVAAVSFHEGEVERNPYHLSLPIDGIRTVRRGGEMVGVEGGHGSNFHFAILYEAQRFDGGKMVPAFEGKKQVSLRDRLDDLLVA